MIIVNSPIKQEEIIKMLESNQENNIQFKLANRDGIKIYFTVTGTSLKEAVSFAKKIIRSTSWGSVLYFQVTID